MLRLLTRESWTGLAGDGPGQSQVPINIIDTYSLYCNPSYKHHKRQLCL